MSKIFIKVAIGYIIFEVIMYLVISFSALQLNPIYWSEDFRIVFSVWTIFMLFVALVFYVAGKASDNKYKQK